MIELSRKNFSKAVGAVLKANFPELGTQKEMDGADTVDALNSLYILTKAGSNISGMPKSNPDPLTDRDAALSSLSDAIRDLFSARVSMQRAGFRDSLRNEIDYLIERVRVYRVTAEELTR